MRKFFTLLLLISITSGFSQTMENLKTETQKMYQFSIVMNFDEVIDMTYPKLFEIVDRETLWTMMQSMFDNEVMTVSLIDLKPEFLYSEIKEVDGKKFNVIKYRNGMKMALKGAPDEQMVAMMEH